MFNKYCSKNWPSLDEYSYFAVFMYWFKSEVLVDDVICDCLYAEKKLNVTFEAWVIPPFLIELMGRKSKALVIV